MPPSLLPSFPFLLLIYVFPFLSISIFLHSHFPFITFFFSAATPSTCCATSFFGEHHIFPRTYSPFLSTDLNSSMHSIRAIFIKKSSAVYFLAVTNVIFSRSTGFILESFPRNPDEARYLSESGLYPDCVVNLATEEDDIIKRLLPPLLEKWKKTRDKKLAKKQKELELKLKKRVCMKYHAK